MRERWTALVRVAALIVRSSPRGWAIYGVLSVFRLGVGGLLPSVGLKIATDAVVAQDAVGVVRAVAIIALGLFAPYAIGNFSGARLQELLDISARSLTSSSLR